MTNQEFRAEVGRLLRETRKSKGMSQRAAADAALVTQAAVSNYESGKREAPVSVLLRLAFAYDVPLGSLLPRVEGVAA